MNTLKGKLPEIYTSYVLSLFFQAVLPKTIPRRFVDKQTKKFTIAFSNVPGPIKQFFYEKADGELVQCLSQQSYIIPSGYVGCGIQCISSQDSFKITLTSDDGVWSQQ
jgi:hypothetical protein